MKQLGFASLLTAMLAATGFAGPYTFSLIPSDGTVTAGSGGVTGWGIDFTNSDTSTWVVLNDSFATGNLGLGTFGTYVDYIASQLIVIGPNSTFSAAWDKSTSSGVGEFDVANFVPPSTSITGTINLEYSVFSQDPTVNPDAVFLSSDTASAAADVKIVPEPASFLLMFAGAIPLALLRRRKTRT